MLRRFLSAGAPLHRRRGPVTRFFSRLLLSRQSRIALFLLTLAALANVILHAQQYSVRRPIVGLDEPFATTCREPDVTAPRENAALVMLARNGELAAAKRTVESIERHFNRWFHYPIVFLNDEAWDDEFVTAMNATVSGEARFEVIPQAEWTFPAWMDVGRARESIARQGREGILYAGMETYHHMCRFYSGKFYTLDALKQYRWYWRIEPDVDFHCSITYDPFVEMARRDKVYGYTISLPEEPATCPTLFREIADWKEQHNIPTTDLWRSMVSPSWAPWPVRSFLSWFRHRDRFGDGWSLCHYWSNFEIANLDFFRKGEYQDMFQYLDKTGKFYTERWGDAAVHSLALAMLLDAQRVHHFEDFGYRHDWFFQCPANAPGGQLPGSELLSGESSSWAPEREGGIGCRCECDGSRNVNFGRRCLNRLKKPNTTKQPPLWEAFLGWFL
ncbi:nucleotide-diphospho-sugar transferase [Lasiosphaeria hispida]|uniref:Nucleotide-diphospho-sugar transferase n=1 Tax=Lasiosphaeria hispida TaxID=260671 RepID=A0AAJ0MD07_9PEZI|nr:nucleotide-diphospho-sugar transferase [Lasiosphaeria hispida]